MTAPATGVDLDELQRQVQGNILRTFGKDYHAVRHLVLEVADKKKARAALASMLDEDPSTPCITSAELKPADSGMDTCLNLGITFQGLKALGVPKASLATFPPEFVEGIVPRAPRLGDVGDSSPEHWRGGLANPKVVHLIVSIYGRTPLHIAPESDKVLNAEGGHAFRLVSAPPFEGQLLVDPGGDTRRVHFGYVDGISQPRFEGIHNRRQPVDRQPFAPLGAVLLGPETALAHLRWGVPQPTQLGHNGSFNAFRVLGQNVKAFEDFLTKAAEQAKRSGRADDADPELVAAKLCGRWRNGAPLTRAPDHDTMKTLDPERYNDFDYPADDSDGARCPIGAHIRRCNPRGAEIVQRAANRTRPIVRRGMPYGPRYEDEPVAPRGLLGNFICANLAAQFEAVQYDWVNLGFQDPSITGTNDPLVGANDGTGGGFIWPVAGDDPIVLDGLKRFVTTEGGAYCFLPSLPAIEWISAAGWKNAGWS